MPFITPHTYTGNAQRIVSLVPSQTELLHALGLEEETVGITKFCIHPTEWFRHKTRVGGTKQVKMDVIKDLSPDLVLANKEENNQADVEALAALYPVYMSDITTLEEAAGMITDIGTLTGRLLPAQELVHDIRASFARLHNVEAAPLPAAYLIWRNPYMTVGHDTFINDMMGYCGLTNVFASASRYPVVGIADIKASGCRMLLLSSEPYPFKEKHIAELQAELPGVIILLADGEMFSWYGSRLLQAALYFEQLRASLLSMHP
jgi:ABC-type Fe3+-hydroxamate transport system substrate-binding protein